MILFAQALIAAIAAAASRLRLFSLRELAVHRRRTIASIAVMAVSAMYLVAIFGIFGSITGSVNRLAGGVAGIAALEVSGITDAGFPDSIAADVAAVPGVAVAAPMIRMSAPTASRPVLLFGADKSSAEVGGTVKDAVSGPLEEVSQATDGVQVGPGVGHAKGEQFQLGSGTVTVTDVLTGKQLADLNGGQYVLAPLTLAQNVTERQGQLDSILITTKPGADLAAVRASVTSAVNGRAIVAPPSMRAARAGDGVKMMNYMALMGAVVALVVGAFLVYTTMTMAITQRRPVISMLRAIGGRRNMIVRDMLAEAAILGVIGGAVGSGLGILLGRIAIGRLPPAVTQGLEARVEYLLPGYAIPAALTATVMTVLIAVVTTVMITGTNADMIRSARGIFSPVADADVWVSADSPDRYPTNPLPQGLSEKVAAVPGVAHVAEGAFAFADVGGTRVMLDGFSSGTADALYHALDEQTRNDVLSGRGVVLTQNLGKTLDVRVGDELPLQTPHGAQRTTVLALVPFFSTVIGTVGMELDQMREWFDRPAATTLQ